MCTGTPPGAVSLVRHPDPHLAARGGLWTCTDVDFDPNVGFQAHVTDCARILEINAKVPNRSGRAHLVLTSRSIKVNKRLGELASDMSGGDECDGEWFLEEEARIRRLESVLMRDPT